MLKLRGEVLKEDQWDLSELYESDALWESRFTEAEKWDLLSPLEGTLKFGPEKIVKVLSLYFTHSRELEKLYTYMHLKTDEDLANSYYKASFSKISSLVHQFSHQTSWIEPELLKIKTKILEEYIQSEALQPYAFYLQKILKMKPHTLSKKEEALVALAQKPLSSTKKAFAVMNDADFSFGKIIDGKGDERELTHGSYGLFLRSKDRELRKNAFLGISEKYVRYENTLAELLSGAIESHFFNAKTKKFKSCLDAALFPKNVPLKVYKNLITTTKKNLAPLHRYLKLRKKILNVETLHFYDLYVSLTSESERSFSYQEGEALVIDSVAPLGEKYQENLKKGFLKSRWVDRFENKNKRSGAYSSGCYDSHPYILMNYKDQIRDVFTLAHEAGHSMHSYLSRQHQPYWYADYPIFVAEVASTFNEDLLMRHLLEKSKTKNEKIFLINQKIEDIRGTFFRQTLFAEFELMLHEMVEQGIPFTAKHLKEVYLKLVHEYYGDTLVLDDLLGIEWARIPHFYYNFYVYQYATGISASLFLAKAVMEGGKSQRDAYLQFLGSGSSKYPIDLLRIAGVDMEKEAPIQGILFEFDRLVTTLEQLISTESA